MKIPKQVQDDKKGEEDDTLLPSQPLIWKRL